MMSLSEEQQQQRKLDQENIDIELLVKGDAINFPVRYKFPHHITLSL